MSSELTRRGVLAGLLSSAGTAALARAPSESERPLPRGTRPEPPPVPAGAQLVGRAGLGGAVGYAVADMKSGEVLEAFNPDLRLPPASTMKAVTALYALDRLGPSHQFSTEILATGPIEGGKLKGDLVLAGGGDPTLDTDRLGALAIALREAGVSEVTGKFLVWPGSLPSGDRIDADQPEHVSYNPAWGGLNLNYNRVHFEWEKNGDGYGLTMQARGLKFSPSTQVARMSLSDRSAPIFQYHGGTNRDRWSVSTKALGKEGARWLPVRFPAYYAADVFRTLARSNGIVIGAPEVVGALPEGSSLVSVGSARLVPMLKGMLKYSTNLTAEVTGLAASVVNGVPVGSLLASGSRMAGWAEAKFGAKNVRFRDHSGLGYGSEVSAREMVRILGGGAHIKPILKPVNLSLDKKRPAPDGVSVSAKTGTLNFVSSLAGYATTTRGRELAFAIFTADTARRDAIPPEARERPQGARSWSRRSRQLQKELLRGWTVKYNA